MRFPSRLTNLRPDLDLRNHHFHLVQEIAVKPLRRGLGYGVMGMWYGNPTGQRHYIYLAPWVFNGPPGQLKFAFTHEVGHNWLEWLIMQIGDDWKQDRRFQATYQLREQWLGNGWLMWWKFGIRPNAVNENVSEFFCHMFSCLTGGNGRKKQAALEDWMSRHIKVTTVEDILGGR